MVCPGVIFDRILDELESGKTNRIKREVVRATCIRGRQRRGSEVLKRRKPRSENPSHCFVALQVDSAHLTRPVVEIEVNGEDRVIRLECQRTSRGRSGAATLLLARRGSRPRGEVLIDVGA